MIIKGLFRRYERWNPVHPTSGAFWGMGIGIGCGVGWGPGFGPEVIGYVGAGCGIGFSVGLTLAGIGIGLPANWLVQIPYNALTASSNVGLEFIRSNALPVMKNAAGDGWSQVSPSISGFGREARGRLSCLRFDHSTDHGFGFADLERVMMWQAKSAFDYLVALRSRCLPPGIGTKPGTP